MSLVWNLIKGKRTTKSEEIRKRVGLEAVLCTALEGDVNLQKTVLGAYDALVQIRDKYFYSFRRTEDGMMILINPRPGKYDDSAPPFSIEGMDGTFVPKRPERFVSVQSSAGQAMLEDLIYENGIIEADGGSGNILSFSGYLHIAKSPKTIAQERGIFSVSELGFNEQIRKKLGGKNYTTFGTRHLVGMSVTGLDPDLVVMNISRQAMGVISIFKDYKMIFSSIESEIHKDYLSVYEAAKKSTPLDSASCQFDKNRK